MNYIEILKEALEEIRFKLNNDEVMKQMDNARYHWTTKTLEFYSNKGIKVKDWPPYSPDLNPIENILVFMKKQLEGKWFTTMNQLKNKLYDICESVEEGIVENM